MDDCETPAYNLQVEPQGGCHPGDGVESAVTRLPSASDENENQLGRDGHGCLTGSDSTMGRPEVTEQDSLNNNDSCTPGCAVAASESSENTPREGPRDGQDWPEKDKKLPGKRSSRSRGGTAKKIPPGIFSYLLFMLLLKNKSSSCPILWILSCILLFFSYSGACYRPNCVICRAWDMPP